jgi:hypothetical protein
MRLGPAAVRMLDMARFGMRPIPATWLAIALIAAVASVPISFGREEWFDTALYPVNAAGLALAGALIASRQRTNPLGWLMLAMGVDAAWTEWVEGYSYHAAWPAASTMGWLNSWISWPSMVAYTIMLALFPTGRNLGRVRQTLVGTGAVATVLATTGAAIGPAGDFVGTLGQAMFAGSLVAAIVVLVVRVRRSAGV